MITSDQLGIIKRQTHRAVAGDLSGHTESLFEGF